ncbi:hypothetical protein [Streptomyces sp. AA1529]|uniref:hypothetical protein n=1 Tax=Streptomyces sp. AA1529 TaxID=1203257 RepID=UPI0005615721|nr:hypothetical protein [Streptomyces sp. AA1529]MBE9500212.1 hypothetical protein [Streptomyces sp. GKU 257-1]
MAACGSTGNPVLDFAKGFFDFLGDPIGTIIKGIANAIMTGALSAFTAVTEAIPTFSTTASSPVHNQVKYVVVYLAIGSLLFACVRMASERRVDAGQTALRGMVRLIVVAGGGTTIMTAAAGVGDGYADYLFEGAVNAQIKNMGCGSSEDVPSFLYLILAFLLLIAAVVHGILLYVRLGVMIVLFGTLPLAAAASMLDWGGSWWRKHIGWMLAWLLYKPTAGLVIYAGTALTTGQYEGAENENIHTKIAGICVMLLSAISLPALLKLVVPATAALGGSGAYSGAVSGAAGGIASGAKSVGSAAAAGGGGKSGSGGKSGATGASGPSGGGGKSGGGGLAAAATGSRSSGGGGGGPGSTGGGSGGAGGGGRGGGAPSGAARGAAAGPAGVALVAASTAKNAAKGVGNLVSGAVEDADGGRAQPSGNHDESR